MKMWLGLLCTIILSLGTILPLAGRTYFPMHDDTQVARVVVMGKALRQGQFPVRWVSDLGYGYGYPMYNFYGPLPYYVGGGLYAMGVGSVLSTKIMFGAGAMLAAIFCFLLLESVFGVLGGIMGSVLFVYAPYHAVQIYIRGAVGEYWAVAFIPLVLWGILLTLHEKKYLKGIVVGSLGLAGVIVSHTILGFLTTVISLLAILSFSVVRLIRKRSKWQMDGAFFATIAAGLGISAFFWLPAILEMQATSVSAMITGASTGFFDHFVCVRQLWDSPWGYGGSAVDCATDGMSFKLGKFHIGLAIIGIICWVMSSKRKKKTNHSAVTTIGFFLFCISTLAMLDISKPVWSIIPFVSFIQYPWRFLSFTMLAVGILGGATVSLFGGRMIRLAFTCVVIVVCIAINAKLFRPQYFYMRDSAAFETATELRYKISKISDEYLPQDIVKPKTPQEIVTTLIKPASGLSVQLTYETDTFIRAELDSEVDQEITINKAFFPGWLYRLNGRDITPVIVAGLPSVVVSKGQSILELYFTNTAVRIWGNVISLLTIIFLTGVMIYGKKTNT